MSSLQQDNPESMQTCRNSSGQPGRATAYDHDISLVPFISHCHPYYLWTLLQPRQFGCIELVLRELLRQPCE